MPPPASWVFTLSALAAALIGALLLWVL